MPIDRHKWRLAGIMVLVAALGGVLCLAAGSREPRYAGKPLSAWLDVAPLHPYEYERGDRMSEIGVGIESELSANIER